MKPLHKLFLIIACIMAATAGIAAHSIVSERQAVLADARNKLADIAQVHANHLATIAASSHSSKPDPRQLERQLRINPDQAFAWLVSIDHSEIRYVTPPRHLTPVPLVGSVATDPVSRAAGAGQRGFSDGLTLNGAPVLVHVEPVGKTPWLLLLAVERDLALEGLDSHVERVATQIAALALLALMATVSAVRYINVMRRETAATEAALNERLGEAQEIGRMGTWERDLGSGAIHWSSFGAKLFADDRGRSPRTIAELHQRIYPEDRHRVVTAAEEALHTSGTWEVEFRLVAADGSLHNLLERGRINFSGQDKPLTASGSVTDITDFRQQEALVRNQRSTLLTILDHIPGGVVLTDSNENLLDWNLLFVELLDIAPEDIAATPVNLQAIHRSYAQRIARRPEDAEHIANLLESASRHPGATLIEDLPPHGQSIEIQASRLPDGSFVTMYSDVSARRHAEEHLQLAKTVFEHSPTAIVITDRDACIISVNPSFTEITGFTPEDALGKTPRMLKSGRHDSAFYAALWAQLNSEGCWSGEIWDRRKNGEIYPKWLSINAVRDPHTGKISKYIGMFTDISKQKRAEERIAHLAHHDPLTGLANRFTLMARLEQAFADARRNNRKVAVIFLDLDRFKTINDSLGHHIGDLLLVAVAERLRGRMRESDIVARLGGDEFVVAMTDVNEPDDVTPIATALIDEIAQPVPCDAAPLSTSASLGISLFPDDGSDVTTIMKTADMAMYHAKSSGRNNYQFYSPDMNAAANERLQTETKLRSALARQEFEVYYQLQVDAAGRRPTGVEALLRWHDPEHGLTTPDRFIPVCEETGLIVDIGDWVLRAACTQACAWNTAGFPLRMAVNVSARQLRKSDFIAQVAAALKATGLPAHQLELEITESAVMVHPQEAIAQLQAIKDMGVMLAIDDFGTGYSSLAYLKQFPLDRLKIDKTFTRDIETDPDDLAIALGTIALAHSLGLTVIAEGVENMHQADLLVHHGCDELQGYLFSRPLPATEVTRLLAATALQRNAATAATTTISG